MNMSLGDFICSIINKKVDLETQIVDYLMAIAPELLSYPESVRLVDLGEFPNPESVRLVDLGEFPNPENMRLIDIDEFPKQLAKYVSRNAEKVRKKVQPHGNWRERIYTGGTSHYYCSECGFEIDMFVGGTYNYCPHCGAKMDETE